MSARAPHSPPARRRLALALGLAFLHAGVGAQTAAPAMPAAPTAASDVPPTAPAAMAAQAAPAAAAAAPDSARSPDGLQLDRIVITGSTVLRSKFKQSVSVSSLDGEQLQKSGAASATELLRAVPGLRAESTGGEGNANLGVRGLPMSDGGGRYVQLQEDGLPILLFGDISFSTADQYLRADYGTDSIDVLRGGSSSTLATNASGAIVNFIGKTGKDGGGAVGLSFGLGYKQQRLDFAYGGALGSKTYFHISGFQRSGEGVRHTNVTAENGGQVRLSLTKEFDGGYVRATYKHLADSTPTYLPVPVRLNGNKIEEIPGVDPRTAYFINSNFTQDVVTDRHGNRQVTDPSEGLKVGVDAFGLEAQVALGSGWSATNRFRHSRISGRFLGVFPAGSAPTDPANGANQYTGSTPVFSAHVFNTALDDMGNVFNDLRLQKNFELGGGSKLGLTGGLFTGQQKIAQTWYWNRYNIGLSGENAALYDNAGAVSNLPVADGTQTWGGCCMQNFAYDINATAPYAALSYEGGALTVDASLRHDRQRGTGYFMTDVGTSGVWDRAGASRVSYTTSANSYSLGANFEFNRALAVFARASHGASWKAPDRVLGDARIAAGLDPYPVNEVDQLEGGFKYRQNGLSAFVTAFFAKTSEGAGFELTTQTVRKNDYDSKGVEAEVSWRLGGLRLAGGATFTKASITSGANKGKTPRRQADLVYQLQPSYSFGDLEVGGAVIGTSKSYAQDDNQVVLPAYAVVNAFVNLQFGSNATLQFGMNNLFDQIGYTEAEGQGNLTNNALYVARSINGRSAKVTLKYAF